MSLAASLLVLCAMTASVDMLQFRRDKTHSPDGLASYQRKIKHEALMRITRTFFSTLKLTEKRASYFGQVEDWKAVRAGRNQKEFAFINEFLARRKLPPAVLDSTVMHDGWVYTLFDNSFFFGRILGPRRLDDALYKARGELTWLIYRGRGWDTWVPSNRTRPRGNSRYYDGDYAPIAWAKGMGHELDRSLAHFFTVRRCWLTGDEWEEPRDMTKCGLDAWVDDALEFEKAFKANAIKIG